MGGRSTSQVGFGDGGLAFSGTIWLENNGGFTSARGPADPIWAQGGGGGGAADQRCRRRQDLPVAGGQRRAALVLHQRFYTEAAVAQSYDLPIAGFQPVGMHLEPAPNAPQTLDLSTISQVSVYILDRAAGPL